MSLPEQIQKQVDAAQAIADQHYGTGDAAATAEPSPPAESSADAATTQTPEPATNDQTAAPQRDDENSETYAQRWRSLQGVYNVTAQKARDLESRTQNLEALIQSMKAPAKASEPTVTKFLTDSDTTEYGADAVDFTKRAAREELAPVMAAIAELRAQVDRLQGVTPVVNQLVNSQRMTAEERFFADIAREIPDWQKVNSDPKFQDWLLSPDPMTGITRQTYLEDAQRSFDSARATNIFKIWSQVPGVPRASNDAPRATPNKASSELERQIAPGRHNAASVPAPTQEKQWTPQEITGFYADVRNGKYKSREADRERLERDIFLAQREGRILRSAA